MLPAVSPNSHKDYQDFFASLFPQYYPDPVSLLSMRTWRDAGLSCSIYILFIALYQNLRTIMVPSGIWIKVIASSSSLSTMLLIVKKCTF